MKLKAAITQGAPDRVVVRLNAPEFARRVFKEVLGPFLNVLEMGPAEFYVQEADRTICTKLGSYGCEVRLTGVSAREGRDYEGALDALTKLYVEEITDTLGEHARMQLFVVIMLDTAALHIDGTRSTIFESKPVWLGTVQ